MYGPDSLHLTKADISTNIFTILIFIIIIIAKMMSIPAQMLILC